MNWLLLGTQDKLRRHKEQKSQIDDCSQSRMSIVCFNPLFGDTGESEAFSDEEELRRLDSNSVPYTDQELWDEKREHKVRQL